MFIETTDLVFAVTQFRQSCNYRRSVHHLYEQRICDSRATFAVLRARRCDDKFRYLRASLAVILAVVGIKMLAADVLKQWMGPAANFYLLGLVAAILLVGIIASIANPAQPEPADSHSVR